MTLRNGVRQPWTPEEDQYLLRASQETKDLVRRYEASRIESDMDLWMDSGKFYDSPTVNEKLFSRPPIPLSKNVLIDGTAFLLQCDALTFHSCADIGV
jgi:hypothetical protein